MAYSNKVIDHYENPRNVGTLDKNDESVGTGLVGAPACGDVMRLQIKVGDDGRIQDAKFKTFGCGSAIASSSLATEWLKGKTVDEAATIKNSMIAEELHLPPVKIHCTVVAEGAIRVGIRGGGCSGFSYVIEFEDNPPRTGDLVLEFSEEGKPTVRVICDKKSIIYLGGSVLDWEKTLMFQGFKFKNPQEATRC